jgi:hypothetical protein
MVEIKEVLLLWLGGAKKKRIAAQLSLDVKTVHRYVAAAESIGLTVGAGAPSDEQLGAVVHALQPSAERQHGDGWQKCESERAEIERLLAQRVRLSKVRRMLHRRGVDVPYSTLHRFGVAALDFGRHAPTIPVLDGEPGEEVHIDTGWMTQLEPDERGRRRRFRAWIFTPHLSRYRFVYPCFEESTETAIAACEAAWEFYGGVFGVVVPGCRRRGRSRESGGARSNRSCACCGSPWHRRRLLRNMRAAAAPGQDGRRRKGSGPDTSHPARRIPSSLRNDGR